MKRFFALFLLIVGLLAAGNDLYAQDYKVFLDQGVQLYNKHQYDEAIKVFQAGMADGSEAAKSELGSWITKCRNAKAAAAQAAQRALERFEISQDSFSFTSAGGAATVDVQAGSTWKVVSQSCDWCAVKSSKEALELNVAANPNLEARDFSVDLQMTYKSGNSTQVKKKSVKIHQDARDEAFRNIVFRTHPDNATISFTGKSLSGWSGDSFRLGEGEHEVTISKNEYEPVKMVVPVTLEDSEDVRFIDVDLKPQFALFHLVFDSTDESVISSASSPVLKIGDNIVGVDGYFSGKYDASLDSREERVEKFKLYRGNYIAVPAGEYRILAEAKGYEQAAIITNATIGTERDLEIKLSPKMGRLKLTDIGGADGARVIADRKDVGEVPSVVSLPLGTHVITFLKEGSITLDPNYTVDILEGADQEINVEMFKYATVDITSQTDGAAINVDGRFFNAYTPAEKLRVPVGQKTITLDKQGFMAKPIKVNLAEGDTTSIAFDLKETHPLTVSAGKENLYIIVKDDDDYIFTCDSITPNTVYVPYGDYTLELRRFNKYRLAEAQLKKYQAQTSSEDLAYKRDIKFNAQTGTVRVNSFSDNGGYSIVTGNYVLNLSKGLTDYKIADASLCKVPLFKGFSTNVFRASAFSHNNDTFFTGSILFLNGELRIGGAIFDYLDVSALGVYSWLPNLSKIDSFKELGAVKHYEGWDGFAGIEFCSRVPVFNACLRIGEQFLSGYFYNPSLSSKAVDTDPTPVKKNMFVISLGFTLGTKGSKGANMIRCW